MREQLIFDICVNVQCVWCVAWRPLTPLRLPAPPRPLGGYTVTTYEYIQSLLAERMELRPAFHRDLTLLRRSNVVSRFREYLSLFAVSVRMRSQALNTGAHILTS